MRDRSAPSNPCNACSAPAHEPGWAVHDPERHSLMRVTPKTPDLQVPEPCVESVTERGRGLRRILEAQHPHVPRLAGELISFLAGRSCMFGRHADRMAEEVLSGLGGHVEFKRVIQR